MFKKLCSASFAVALLLFALCLMLLVGCTGGLFAGKMGLDASLGSQSDISGSLAQETAHGESGAVNPLSDWHYRQLSDTEKTLYLEMYTIASQFSAEGALIGADKDEIDRAFMALCADHPELFWLGSYSGSYISSGNKVLSVTFRPGYTMDKAEAETAKIALQARVHELLTQLGGQDDYEKALAVFSTLATQTTYDESVQDSQSLLSCLVDRRAVCAGYSRAMQYVMNEMGIYCTYVSGTANGQNHAWNLLRLDGGLYYSDVTWGDTDTVLSDGTELLHYEYFTMTTDQLLVNHTLDSTTTWPECTDTDDLFGVRTGWAMTTWDTVQLETLLVAAAGQQCREVMLQFDNSQNYAQACQTVENGDIYYILQHVHELYAPALLVNGSISYYRNDARLALTLVLEYINDAA